MISSGISVPAIVKNTDTLGRKAIMVRGGDDILGYTTQVAKNVYTPTVCLNGTQIELPSTHRRLEAIGDIIRHLADIKDSRLDLPWWEMAISGHTSEHTPQSPQKKMEV